MKFILVIGNNLYATSRVNNTRKKMIDTNLGEFFSFLYNCTKILRVKKSRSIEGEKGENSLNIIFTVVIDAQYFEWFEQIFQLPSLL